jgi:hypothetical protein
MSFEALSLLVRDRALYPRDGKIVHADGEDLANRVVRAQGMQQAENRINALVYEMKSVKRSHRETQEKALDIAENSTDPYELHYLANMFADQKEVMRALSRNQHLAVKTQTLIVRNPTTNRDRETLMNLAHNPSITAETMDALIDVSDDPFVLQGVALNAVRRSRETDGLPYATICNFLARHPDYTLSKAAVAGVKDPELLREIVDNNSLLLSPAKLGEVARNPHTPDDVLERMSTQGLPSLQRSLGFDVADNARHTLEVKKRARMQEQEVTNSL